MEIHLTVDEIKQIEGVFPYFRSMRSLLTKEPPIQRSSLWTMDSPPRWSAEIPMSPADREATPLRTWAQLTISSIGGYTALNSQIARSSCSDSDSGFIGRSTPHAQSSFLLSERMELRLRHYIRMQARTPYILIHYPIDNDTFARKADMTSTFNRG